MIKLLHVLPGISQFQQYYPIFALYEFPFSVVLTLVRCAIFLQLCATDKLRSCDYHVRPLRFLKQIYKVFQFELKVHRTETILRLFTPLHITT